MTTAIIILIFGILINIYLTPKRKNKYKRKTKTNSSPKQRYERKPNNINTTNGYNSFYKRNKKPMTNQEKKEKGDRYEAYITEHFRDKGYYVWEHGKEKGRKDGGIDLFIKKEKQAYFVQCKNWETWKINDKNVKATQTDVRNYMIENQNLTKLLKECNKKILYVTSKECLTKGAWKYIDINKDILEYQVIPIIE